MHADRYAWVKAVLQSELSAAEKNIASALALEYLNASSGQLNPKQTTIASYLRIHPGTVKKAIRALASYNWLEVIPGQGRGKHSSYRLIMPPNLRKNSLSEKGYKSSPQGQENRSEKRRKGEEIVPSYIEEHCKEHSGGRKRGSQAKLTEQARFWAEKINEGRYVSPTAVSSGLAHDMLRKGLVSAEQLRDIGVSVRLLNGTRSHQVDRDDLHKSSKEKDAKS